MTIKVANTVSHTGESEVVGGVTPGNNRNTVSL